MHNSSPSLVSPRLHRRNRAAFRGYFSRIKLLGPLPSFQSHIDNLSTTRRFLANWILQSEPLREVRFPYYDRDLLEFMYAIPREQIVRVGQRRSLMKRALVGIIPDEILNRKKREVVSQESPKSSPKEPPELPDIGRTPISSGAIGIVDPGQFAEALQKARCNEDVPIGSLKRTLTLESWLRHLTLQGVLTNSVSTKRQEYYPSLDARKLSRRLSPRV